MGPSAHCKHACALLFALYRFSTFQEIITEETCTQRLQTFHLPAAPYKGSPIKTRDLQLSQKNENVCFDPRPDEFKNVGYSNF